MTELPKSKGARPVFLADPCFDDLLAITMALAQELAVLRERFDSCERLLAQSGALSATAIDDFRPDSTIDAEREAWRRDYLDRILYVVNCRAEETSRGDSAAGYAEIIRQIGDRER